MSQGVHPSDLIRKGGHVPVLLEEVIRFLDPQPQGVYVDATFGGGGYTRAILDRGAGRVIAMDRDPEAQAKALLFKEQYADRFNFILSNFSDVDTCLSSLLFDGIVFDFGVSSFQLETPERGFSFQVNGPLDMRMGIAGITAEEVINTYREKELEQIIKVYGQERFARKISHAILKQRKLFPFKTTFELADVVRSVVPREGLIDPATKTFQAFRIFVNDELNEIDKALDKIMNLIVSNQQDQMRIVTVTFHSLEDKIVKNWVCKKAKIFLDQNGYQLISETPKVVAPSFEEIRKNPRSRSAKLRSALIQRRKS